MYLPMGLAAALEEGNCVLFLGSGIGHYMRDSKGGPVPDSLTLARKLAERFEIDAGEAPELAQVAEVVQGRKDRRRLVDFLEGELKNVEPDSDLRWLLALTWKAVFTTNYDDGIETCYRLNSNPTQTPVVISTNSESRAFDPRFQVPVYHLHGSLFSAAGREAILITEQDYSTFHEQRQMLFDQFRNAYAGVPILYVGYSHRDANWRTVTSEVRRQFSPSEPPPGYRLSPCTPALEKEILGRQGITTIDGDLPEFRASIETTFGELRVEPHNLEAMKRRIPTDFHQAFQESPAAAARLLNNWDYVNQADFAGKPNTDAFLRGDLPNWALVGRGINFQRDLEEPLHDRLVEFATSPTPGLGLEIVLGPAGYGVTTLLMATATWFASEKVGAIFFLKSGMEANLADIEFACHKAEGAKLFVIDDAADHAQELGPIAEFLRNSGQPAFLLLGERLNEWRQKHSALRPKEWEIEPLSDREIDELLLCLDRESALGRLGDLSPDIRFQAIKNKNQQELLVTMREVTEGKQFDAIIEDEYRSIDEDGARKLYGLVCAFSRTRSLARDSLCADALGWPISKVYETLDVSLHGIVVWQTVDEARGVEALRTRHHSIGEIVWDRCLDRLDRQDFLLGGLKSINLTYGVDAKAFEAFTRDDASVDSLTNLESKVKFFEAASRKQPRNPFVLQHFARMLRREGKFELALGQIELALLIDPHRRVLIHTKGIILKDMAVMGDSKDVARRRLVQSEDAFRRTIQQNPRDEYGYQSLAELYLEWAKKSRSEQENVDYIAKAQDVVLAGLHEARAREGLYLVAARIEEEIGDGPARLQQLQFALDEAPESAVVRYILGQALYRQGEYAQAEPVLPQGLVDHPEDPNLALVYALTLSHRNRPYSECIAPLHLTRAKGIRIPRFVATYGGMLVMDGHSSEAEDIWRRAEEQNFTIQDERRISFVPHQEERPLNLEGRVSKMSGSYAFVSSPGMPDFFCSPARYSGLALRLDSLVTFEPGFSARGPSVSHLSLKD